MTKVRPDNDMKNNVVLVCNCERSMALDGGKLARCLGRADEKIVVHSQLCRREMVRFEAAIEGTATVMVGCTQEAPLFREAAEDKGREGVRFVNLRERAGWTADDGNVHPKIAALIAEAAYQVEPTPVMSIESEGQCLVYGRGQQALDVAEQLAGRLSVSVILTEADDAIPPSVVSVPIYKGRIRRAKGALAGFSVSVDGFAAAEPASRERLSFATPRDGFSTTCDMILDIAGGAALFSGEVRPDGYLRADPGDPLAVARAVFEAADLVGEFEKPIYVDYDAGICAHSRSAKIGCSRCLDNCPTGAITPNGDAVTVDAAVCGGCGNCSAVCPTGAVSYAYPSRGDVAGRIQVLASTYREAGGAEPVLLVHDDTHGAKLIAMLARYGRGLPARVIPMSLYSVFQVGHDALAAALAFGFDRVVVLAPPDKPHEMPALESQVGLINAIMAGLGHGEGRVSVLVERDPDVVGAALYELGPVTPVEPRTFATVGGKREIARTALSVLNASAAPPREVLALPDGAPYGRIAVDVAGCTLCLACVGSCPTGALSDDADRPRLRFTELACVQCGLCVATCPERVIGLEPRYNFSNSVLEPVTIKEEEPFECIKCGKPFGTKSSIERIAAKLAGRHSMFQNSAQVDIIKMCDNCRVVAITEAGGDPMTYGTPRRVRTTEDYIIEEARARETGHGGGEDEKG